MKACLQCTLSSTTLIILRPAAAQKEKPPINTAFYQHRRRRVDGGGGGGEVSIFKPLSTGSGENLSKINIEIQQTKHEEQRVQPFLIHFFPEYEYQRV
jgi:hypothetical protein